MKHRVARILATVWLGVTLVAVSNSKIASAAETNELRIPASTAYAEPLSAPLRFGDDGITNWTNSDDRIVWFGRLKHTGSLSISISVSATEKSSSKFAMTVSRVDTPGATQELKTTQTVVDNQRVTFGEATINSAGYYRFELHGTAKPGDAFGTVKSMTLSGAAAKDAHFNLKSRRNAASVHLGFPVPREQQVQAFYSEITVETDPLWSYYMACGFHRGYFGIQVNSETERRIIFSIWDSGNEGIDRSKVAPEDQVTLLDKGEGVVAHGFGNEGTGGHSHLVYNWKTGDTHRFLVTAQPVGTNTIFAGYFYFPEKKEWGLIAKFRAPKDGGHLRGLYSFNENFIGRNGHLLRRAAFGNQWIATADGRWHELTTARFTHDVTGKADRKDYSVDVVNGRFVLANGGFLEKRSNLGQMSDRPATKMPPSDINLKKLLNTDSTLPATK
ncbi:MAG: DUF3472 domain-containing protein [Rhodopirellula sp.]|nr:DUF3472 domain-containing protein [Rhodopirellula sp.]